VRRLLLLLVFILTLAPSLPILAQGVYRSEITVSDNSSVDRVYVPALVPFGTTQAVDLGFLTSNGLDIRVYEGTSERKYMVADDKIGILVPSLLANQERGYRFETGYTPASSFGIIPGNGGYYTVADPATMELGNSFQVNYTDVYLTGTANLTRKDDAITVTYASGNVTAGIWGASSNITPNGTNDPSSVWSDDANAIDNNTGTTARYTVAGGTGTFSQYLELETASMTANGIMFWTWKDANRTTVEVDVYDGSWHNVYSGTAHSHLAWYTVTFAAQYPNVTKARFRQFAIGNADVFLYEFKFLESVVTASVSTAASAGEHDVVVQQASALDFVKANSDYAWVADNDVFSFTNGAGVDRPFSGAVWVYLDDATGGALVGKLNPTGNNREWFFYFTASDQLAVKTFLANGGADIGRRSDALTAYEGEKHRVAFSYSGNETNSSFKLFLDGVQIDVANETIGGTYTGMSNTTSKLTMGAVTEGATSPLDAGLSDVMIWNVELTPAQVLADFQTGNAGVAPIAWWKLDEGTGNTLTDSVGGYTATNSGGDWNVKGGPLKLLVDGTLGDWAANLSVPDNANSWYFMEGVPYAGAIEISVSGTQAAYYNPITIISGTTFPDRSGNDNHGTITWGSNYQLSVGVGGIVSTASYVSTSVGDSDPPTVLPLPGSLPMFGETSDVSIDWLPSSLVDPASILLDWDRNTLYGVLVIFGAIGIGVGVAIATGSSLLAAIAVGVGLAIASSTGAVGWWVLVVYAIFGGTYLVAVRGV